MKAGSTPGEAIALRNASTAAGSGFALLNGMWM
jgi:hypothetical protein